MRLRVLQELDDSRLDERQARQVPGINWIKLDRGLKAVLYRGDLLVVETAPVSFLRLLGCIHSFVLNLPPKWAALEEVLMDAKVGADAATAELHDKLKLKELLYQIETSLLVVACFLPKVDGTNAMFTATSDEL
jgi:hypothetical protein